jgi:hypothetical protein
MICPFCAEHVPAGTQLHQACRRMPDKPFPPLYLEHHGGYGQTEPIVVSVIGFPGHGKTVFLCALFNYLDDDLTYLWKNKFHNHVLDQESLSRLNENRKMLRAGVLPPPTVLDFPRPGIFRLKHMPSTSGDTNLPPLTDTTILIYDPPGEAFRTEGSIVDYASFVKRSTCVLFLIDLTTLGNAKAQGMAELLETYVLGMVRMGIRQLSQHLIVVYTKSDELKSPGSEFESLLKREPWLEDYLKQQRPESLADPSEHFKQLERVSSVLADFTRYDLKAAKFDNLADEWFASISYTVVSSLGSAPELYEVAQQEGPSGESDTENGPVMRKRLTAEMSPRGMADPLLYLLANSLNRRSVVEQETHTIATLGTSTAGLPNWAVAGMVLGGVVLLIIILLTLLMGTWLALADNKSSPVATAITLAIHSF